MLETYRECLQDVFDLPALAELLAAVRRREVRVVEVDTALPSPFAGLAPVRLRQRLHVRGRRAARRAPRAGAVARPLAAGRADGPRRAARAARRAARSPRSSWSCSGWTRRGRPRDADDLHDLLRDARRPDAAEVAARARRRRSADVARRARTGAPRARASASPARSAGSPSRTPRATATRSAWRCRSVCPHAFLEPVADPLGDLVARFARGPTARSCPPTSRRAVRARRRGGRAARCARSRWTAASSRASSGPAAAAASGSTPRCCAGCAAARWRRCVARSSRCRRSSWPASGSRGRASAPRRRSGPRSTRCCAWSSSSRACPLPASALESQILPARAARLLAGAARPARRRGRAGVGRRRRARARTTAGSCSRWPRRRRCCCRSRRRSSRPRWRSVCSTCSPAVARSSSASSPRRSAPATTPSCCWRCGSWCGRDASPTTRWRRCARCCTGAGRRPRDGRPRRAAAPDALRAARRRRPLEPGAGRASRTRRAGCTPTAEQLLLRHGVVTRGAVVAERVPGGFAGVYPVLKAFEEAGRCRRGYFVEGLGGAQFAQPGAVDRLRALGRARRHRAGARRHRSRQPVRRGAAMARARRRSTPGTAPDARPARRSSWSTAALVLYVERGGRTLLSYSDDERVVEPRGRGARRGGARGHARPARGAARRRRAPCSTRRSHGRWRRRASTPRRGACASVPEGDTVFLAATRLRAALAGQTLTRTDFRVPRFATVDLAGRRSTTSTSHGKHLLLRIGGGVTLHTHYKMDGSWHLYRPRRALAADPDWQVRALLETAPWIAVGFRLRGASSCSQTAREHEVVGTSRAGPARPGLGRRRGAAPPHRRAAAPDRRGAARSTSA